MHIQRSRRLLAAGLALILVVSLACNGSVPFTHAASPVRTLAQQTPDVVVHGAAALTGHHNPADTLTLDIGLAVRDSADLDAAIAAASNPASPSYGQYVTPAAY